MELPIATPPWSGNGKKIERQVRKAIYDYDMFDGVTNVSVALSGGKDSLTLLFMLKAIAGYGIPPLKISAILVNGEFSCGAGVNVGYLQGICDALDVPFVVKESTQKLETLECYSCSRERRKLLFDAAKELGADTVAFGHHRDDNAQTLLMNLLQKAEFAGNMPKIHMKHYGITIVRPLIYVAEDDIRTFAKDEGFMRIMCRCPVGQNSLRKRAKDVLEEMELTFPKARHNLALAALTHGSKKALEP